MKTKYTIQYFIDKFRAIPTKEIGEGDLCYKCALHHCGVRYNSFGNFKSTREALALGNIFVKWRGGSGELGKTSILRYVWQVNDGRCGHGRTPKQRILSALRSAKTHATT